MKNSSRKDHLLRIARQVVQAKDLVLNLGLNVEVVGHGGLLLGLPFAHGLQFEPCLVLLGLALVVAEFVCRKTTA